jgi:hypothetical protein
MRARRLFALKPAQGADLITLNRMDAGRAPLAAADVQSAGGELNLVPLKIAQLTGPQAMPKGEQDHGRVAMTIAARFAGRRHQGFDLGGREIFPGTADSALPYGPTTQLVSVQGR